MTVRVRAPATSANLGPGFDCAGVALDLWNELEVSDGDGEGATVEIAGEGADELPAGDEHLGVRAWSLLAPAAGKRFAFTNRIPLERGLGSSAATIALGLVGATLALGRWPEPEELLGLGVELEGHADNLAAALAGGACLSWDEGGRRRIARVARSLPLVPIALVPEGRVATSAARAALPNEIPHADASFTVGRAALLGAGLAAGDEEFLGAAFADRLHEPYRAANAPLLGPLREDAPERAAGVTLSGSGPSVIVWARGADVPLCAADLRERFPDASVLPLAVSAFGAGPA